MFNKKEIEESKKEIANLQAEMYALKRNLSKELSDEISEFKSSIRKDVDSLIEDGLFGIRRDMTDEYYNVLNKLLEFNKTIYMTADKKKNIVDDLEQFLLNQKWDKERNEKGNKIINKGAAIIKARQELYEEILRRERQNEKPEKISLLKAKLEGIDEVVRGLE